MELNDISRIVLDASIKVHTKLGPGLLESVYQRALAYELTKRGLTVETEKPIMFHYEELVFDEGFRADIIVNGSLIIELKSVEKLAPVHSKQLLTYLRLSELKLGLLINFGEPLLKDGFHRIANGL